MHQKEDIQTKNMNKTRFVSLRLTEWEYEQLMYAISITKQSKSRFITMAFLEKAQKIISRRRLYENNK